MIYSPVISLTRVHNIQTFYPISIVSSDCFVIIIQEMNSSEYVLQRYLLRLIRFASLTIQIKYVRKILEGTSEYWFTQIVYPVSFCWLNRLLLSIKLILQLDIDISITSIVKWCLEFFSQVSLIGLWDTPTGVWKVIHFNKLNELFVETFRPGIKCKLHQVILCIWYLPYSRQIVVGKYVDSVSGTTRFWFK